MKAHIRGNVLCLSMTLLVISGMAYGQQEHTNTNDISSLGETPWPVAGTVKTARGAPVGGATVLVAPMGAWGSRTLLTNASGEFRTDYPLDMVLVQEFAVALTAKKKGYQTTHAFANYIVSGPPWQVSLTLQGLDENPRPFPVADLISGLAPTLKNLGPSEGLAEKYEADYTRGVADFIDHHDPEGAVPLFARVAENNPTCVGCRTMLALAELAWCDLDDAQEALAESVKAAPENQTMARPEPLVAYATWLSWQDEAEKAKPLLLQALKLAPQNALALQELGRAQTLLQEFEAASETLKKALAAGAGPEARLLEVEALVGAGRAQEAAAEMDRYLGGRDVREMPERVRQVWETVQNRQKVEAIYAQAKPESFHRRLDFLQRPPADLIAGIEPAENQDPLQSILDAVGVRIEEMVKDFPNTSSLEAVHQEKLGRQGKVRDGLDQKFRYLCLMPKDAWGPGFVEYRADLNGTETAPKGLSEGFMLTKGFASAPFFFHPAYRSGSTFRYLGRQDINGRHTYVVAFAQIPAKARLCANFRDGKVTVATFSQGLAWIDTATSQIIRIHTDLLDPLPQFQLERETLDIDLQEVHFAHVEKQFWLPQQVTVALDWNGKRLRNTHAYSNYQVFNVETSETIGKPKPSVNSSRKAKKSTSTQ